VGLLLCMPPAVAVSRFGSPEGSFGLSSALSSQQPINRLATLIADPEENLGADLFLTPFSMRKIALTHCDKLRELGLGPMRPS
jgi:hypothetical protein